MFILLLPIFFSFTNMHPMNCFPWIKTAQKIAPAENEIKFKKEISTLRIALEASSTELNLEKILPSIDICFKDAALNLELQHIQVLNYTNNSFNLFLHYNYETMPLFLDLFPFLERLYISDNQTIGPWLAQQPRNYLGTTLANTLKNLHLNNCHLSRLPHLKLLESLEIAYFDNNPGLGQDLASIADFNTQYFPQSIKYISFTDCDLTRLPEIDFDLFPNLAGIWVNNNPRLILTEEQQADPRIFLLRI